jgi:hypothetical protein
MTVDAVGAVSMTTMTAEAATTMKNPPLLHMVARKWDLVMLGTDTRAEEALAASSMPAMV